MLLVPFVTNVSCKMFSLSTSEIIAELCKLTAVLERSGNAWLHVIKLCMQGDSC